MPPPHTHTCSLSLFSGVVGDSLQDVKLAQLVRVYSGLCFVSNPLLFPLFGGFFKPRHSSGECPRFVHGTALVTTDPRRLCPASTLTKRLPTFGPASLAGRRDRGRGALRDLQKRRHWARGPCGHAQRIWPPSVPGQAQGRLATFKVKPGEHTTFSQKARLHLRSWHGTWSTPAFRLHFK